MGQIIKNEFTILGHFSQHGKTYLIKALRRHLNLRYDKNWNSEIEPKTLFAKWNFTQSTLNNKRFISSWYFFVSHFEGLFQFDDNNVV